MRQGPAVLAAMDRISGETGAPLAAIAQLDELMAFTDVRLTPEHVAALDGATA